MNRQGIWGSHFDTGKEGYASKYLSMNTIPYLCATPHKS